VFSAGKQHAAEGRSPDRAVLALVDSDVVAEAGLGDRPLPELTESDSDPAWSPDGQRIVFSGLVAGNRDLYTVNPDGSDLRRLTASPQAEREPAWSTRGEIAFVRGAGLYVIRADGSGLRRMTVRGRRPDWSPDGSRLVFQSDRRLYTFGRTGRRPRPLMRLGGIYPAWSPSGRRIAFRRDFDIYTVGAKGSGLKRVYNWVAPIPRGGPPARYAPRYIDWGPRRQ